jgi:hypothetical protein
VTGLLSDRYGLDFALQWIPVVSIASATTLYLAYRHYDAYALRSKAHA